MEEYNMNRTRIARNRLTWVGIPLVFAAGLLSTPRPSSSTTLQDQSDNTKMNEADATKDATTADQQKMNPADRALTQKIRAEIMKDKSLSTAGERNVASETAIVPPKS